MNAPQLPHDGRPDWSRINQWLLWIGLASAVAWMVIRHSAHLTQVLPFLLVLACPLMHLFGHRGHHRHHGDAARDGQTDRAADAAATGGGEGLPPPRR